MPFPRPSHGRAARAALILAMAVNAALMLLPALRRLAAGIW